MKTICYIKNVSPLVCCLCVQQVVDDMGNVKFALDTGPDANSNSWLKYVRSAPSFEEQNLVACHLTGDQVRDRREGSCLKTHHNDFFFPPLLAITQVSAEIETRSITGAMKHQVWFTHRSTDKQLRNRQIWIFAKCNLIVNINFAAQVRH